MSVNVVMKYRNINILFGYDNSKRCVLFYKKQSRIKLAKEHEKVD